MTDELRDRFRNAVDELREHVAPSPVVPVRLRVGAGRGSNRRLVLAVAAAVALIGIGGVVVARRGDGGGTILPASGVGTWTKVATTGLAESGRVMALASRGGHDYVAVTASNAPFGGLGGFAVWVSGEGTTWEKVDAPGVGNEFASSLIYGPGDNFWMVVQGVRTPSPRRIYTSTLGREWKLVTSEAPAGLNHIAGVLVEGKTMFVGFGAEVEDRAASQTRLNVPQQPRFWTSPNAREWIPAAISGDEERNGCVCAVTQVPWGLLASGTGNGEPLLWTSTDGRTWTDSAATGLPGGSVGAVASRDGVTVVALSEPFTDGGPVVRKGTAIPLDSLPPGLSLPPGVSLPPTVSMPPIFVDRRSPSTLWTTADGQTFTPTNGIPTGAEIRSVVVVADRFLALGTTTDGILTAWWSEDGTDWIGTPIAPGEEIAERPSLGPTAPTTDGGLLVVLTKGSSGSGTALWRWTR